MIVGKVVGTIVSTRKNEKLVGSKFMVIEPLQKLGDPNSKIVAIDNVGAGIGEVVLVATGSAARIGCGVENSPVDAAIVGIIDDGKDIFEKYNIENPVTLIKDFENICDKALKEYQQEIKKEEKQYETL